MSVVKGKAYDDLYQRLGTKEGEKDIYRMAKIRERKTRDANQMHQRWDRSTSSEGRGDQGQMARVL